MSDIRNIESAKIERGLRSRTVGKDGVEDGAKQITSAELAYQHSTSHQQRQRTKNSPLSLSLCLNSSEKGFVLLSEIVDVCKDEERVLFVVLN